MAALIIILGAGCSGINASRSVSPLDFILPGLLQNKPSDKNDSIVAIPQTNSAQKAIHTL